MYVSGHGVQGLCIAVEQLCSCFHVELCSQNTPSCRQLEDYSTVDRELKSARTICFLCMSFFLDYTDKLLIMTMNNIFFAIDLLMFMAMSVSDMCRTPF